VLKEHIASDIIIIFTLYQLHMIVYLLLIFLSCQLYSNVKKMVKQYPTMSNQ